MAENCGQASLIPDNLPRSSFLLNSEEDHFISRHLIRDLHNQVLRLYPPYTN